MIIIAHRGSHADTPENTLAAFERAITLGADMIEMDVRRCGSGELVLHHDARWEDGRKISAIPLKDLSGMNTFKEVLQALGGKIKINIELKETGLIEDISKITNPKSPVGDPEKGRGPSGLYGPEKGARPHRGLFALGSPLRDYQLPITKNILTSSFHWNELTKLRAISVDIQIAPIVGFEKWSTVLSLPHAVHFAKSIKAFSIHLSRHLAFPWFIQQAHQAGLKVFAYTVNDSRTLKKLQEIGVDGVFTDDVALTKRLG